MCFSPAHWLRFLHYLLRIFIISQCHKPGMAQMIRTRPFEGNQSARRFPPSPTMSNAGLCRMCLGLESGCLQFCGYGPDSHTASSDVSEVPEKRQNWSSGLNRPIEALTFDVFLRASSLSARFASRYLRSFDRLVSQPQSDHGAIPSACKSFRPSCAAARGELLASRTTRELFRASRIYSRSQAGLRSSVSFCGGIARCAS
jgi:hypothetical protein